MLDPHCTPSNNRLLIVFTLFFCLFLASCTTPSPPAIVARLPPDWNIQEDDIRESIFRYLIKTRNSDLAFLSIDGRDPSNEFMARFAGSNFHMTKASGASFKKQPVPGWLRDRSSGKKAVELSVGPISWISITQVEVGGGSYCGGLCADAGVFRVVNKNGRWTVEQYEVRMVSWRRPNHLVLLAVKDSFRYGRRMR